MKRLIFVICSLIFCLQALADVSPVSYTDLTGTAGLTIRAVKTSQCTGAPPATTINGGATIYSFSDLGSGRYYTTLADENYYLFQSSTWLAGFTMRTDTLQDQINVLNATGNVTSADILNETIAGGASGDIASSTITLYNMAANAVNNNVLVDGSVDWTETAPSLKGSSPDQTFNLDLMQDSIRAIMRGVWASGKYNVSQLDSIIKTLILNYTFSAPCSVGTISGTGMQSGIRLAWSMNSVHNDSAAQRFEVYRSDGLAAYASGALDLADLASLRAQMGLVAILPGGSQSGNSFYIPGSGTIYAIVVAFDWHGTAYGSRQLIVEATQADVGTFSVLIGAPGYVEGQSVTATIRDLLNQSAMLEGAIGSFAGQSQYMIYSDFTVADGTGPGTTADLTQYLCTETANPPSRTKIYSVLNKPSGYNNLLITGTAKMMSIGEKGYMYAAVGAQTGNYSIGGLSTAADTTSTTFSMTIPLTSVVEDTPTRYSVSGYVGSAGDSLKFRNVQIFLVK